MVSDDTFLVEKFVYFVAIIEFQGVIFVKNLQLDGFTNSLVRIDTCKDY